MSKTWLGHTPRRKSCVVALEKLVRKSAELTLLDAQLIANQLGYVTYNLIDVGSSVVLGLEGETQPSLASPPKAGISYSTTYPSNSSTFKYPLVSIVYPLNANDLRGRYSREGGLKPFPTVLWMTCPFLHARVSKLEDMGFIGVFQERINSNELFALQMERAHRHYAKFRWELLTSEDRALVEESGWSERLHDVGIAGIKNFRSVKCLHTHYSHFLCRPQDENLIGMWVQEELDRLSVEEKGTEDALMREKQLRLLQRTLNGQQINESERDSTFAVEAAAPDVEDIDTVAEMNDDMLPLAVDAVVA